MTKKKKIYIAIGVIIFIILKVIDKLYSNSGIFGLLGLVGLIGTFPKLWDERFKANIMKASFVGFIASMVGIVGILLTYDTFIKLNLFTSFIVLYIVSAFIFFISFWIFEKRKN